MGTETKIVSAQASETKHWRPAYHYTARRNWLNDPNGLVFYQGEYHLFYQYNPHGIGWGHMSWGHAVSRDLLTWEELPVAMPEREYMIFSGCALVDWHNTSGLGDGSEPPMIALYTAHHDEAQLQAQHLAYSHDHGRTWIDHPGNPVIDRGTAHFRDPKVFWHRPSNAWVMVVALPQDHKVAIYRSPDLVSWELASEFGPAGKTGGQWECPDLLELPIEGEAATVWMLKIDVDKNFIGSVNGAQIFFGTFDGYRFETAHDAGEAGDTGPDFYAAQSWSDLPDHHAAPVWIGWMSNHQSGHAYPTFPWRGAMTLPREVTARREGDAFRLVQRPVVAWDDMVSNLGWREGELEIAQTMALCSELDALVGELRFTCTSGTRITIRVGKPECALVIEIDGQTRSLRLERQSLDWSAKPSFSETAHALWENHQAELRLVFDRQSVEIFCPEECISLTACFFAKQESSLLIETRGGPVRFLASGFQPQPT